MLVVCLAYCEILKYLLSSSGKCFLSVKNYLREIYASRSSRHHLCPICPPPVKNLPLWKFAVVTLGAQLIRNLLAITKFLVTISAWLRDNVRRYDTWQ